MVTICQWSGTRWGPQNLTIALLVFLSSLALSLGLALSSAGAQDGQIRITKTAVLEPIVAPTAAPEPTAAPAATVAPPAAPVAAVTSPVVVSSGQSVSDLADTGSSSWEVVVFGLVLISLGMIAMGNGLLRER